MVWFNLSLLSAVAKAANQAITKILTRNFSVLETAAFGQLAAGIMILPLIFLPSFIAIPADIAFHRAALVTISLNMVAIILLVDAIGRSELSYSLPFLGLTPVFSILIAWMLRGEVIGPAGVLGILFVVLGSLGIDARSEKDWARLGGRRIFRDKGVRLVVIVSFIYAVTSVYDKTATLLSDPWTFVWYSATVRAALFMIFLQGRRRPSRSAKTEGGPSFTHFLLFALLGATFLAEALFQMHAMQTGLVAFVIAIKRLSILMTSLAGMVFFREPFSPARLSGAALIVAGATVIYLA